MLPFAKIRPVVAWNVRSSQVSVYSRYISVDYAIEEDDEELNKKRRRVWVHVQQ